MAKKITLDNDEGHQETEKKLAELEKKINAEYSRAAKEVEEKAKKHLERYRKKAEELDEKVKVAREKYWGGKEKKLPKEELDKLKKEYDTLIKGSNKWKIREIAMNQRWNELRDTLATDLTNASELARSITEGYMPEVYALNHNYATFQVEKSSLVNTSYSLYDRQTVERLMRENPKLMPKMSDETARKIREGKLKKWNEQKLQSEVIQGILQGKTIPDIAKGFRNVAEMDYRASIRNARTSITFAQNGGRMDAYHRADDMGIKQKKQWLSTLDDRTRHTHVELDGQRQELDDPFEIDGYEIMFPGDPDADPSMVYNCRCTMITVFDGFDKQITDYDLTQNEKLGDMTYDEWKKEHEKEKQEEPDKKIEEKHNENAEEIKLTETEDEVDIKDEDDGKLTEKEKEEGVELFRRFVEGESDEIHKLAGYKPFGLGYSEDFVNEEEMKKLDSVFEPAEKEMHVYKGMSMNISDIERLENGEEVNHTLSSTSLSKETANSYMMNAFDIDDEDIIPVFMDITIDEGVPIADVQEILGKGGMKSFEKEITVGRNVVWEYSDFKSKDEDEYYVVKVRVRKR